MNLLGHKISIAKAGTDGNGGLGPEIDSVMQESAVNDEFILKLGELLVKYRSGKQNLDAKIVENQRWYKSQHWDIIRNKEKDDSQPEPVSSYLFNTIANKHADAMDNYPEPNMLPREQMDEGEAKVLTSIIPFVLDKSKFRKVYSQAWWYKLKHGTAVYGVFWNPNLENGLGDIDIHKLDLLNCLWQPGITDVQKSPVFFLVSLVDNEAIYAEYPFTVGKITSNKMIDIKSYSHDDNIDLSDKSLVVDAYYKKQLDDGSTVVHLVKFVDNIKLAATEDDPTTYAKGLYEHGLYPVVFDVLFPEEDLPVGFGYVDVCKNPQMYIDKLDSIIQRNAFISGKQRFLIKENGLLNEAELLDLSKDVIHTKGGVNLGEDYNIFQANSLDPFIVQHRQEKINEMKETTGANDFNRGAAGGGITAASAIMALQEAGNKTSRDMIADSYGVYTEIIDMCIELIRQFYDEDRTFRITNNKGDSQFIKYNNQRIKQQENGPLFEGDDTTFRKPVFDIVIKPEKSSPFSKVAQNEFAKELFQLGFFDPARAEQSLVALEMISFEGKEKIVKMISDNSQMLQQTQQLQQQLEQMQQQQQQQQQAEQQSMMQKQKVMQMMNQRQSGDDSHFQKALQIIDTKQPNEMPEGTPGG